MSEYFGDAVEAQRGPLGQVVAVRVVPAVDNDRDQWGGWLRYPGTDENSSERELRGK